MGDCFGEKRTRFRKLLSVALISSFSVAQDIIEGDLPPGKPFDGTSDRASMFDLYQIANAVLASPANSRRLSDEEFSDSLQNELSARGFPGARIVILPESEPLDRSCSEDETVEVRVSRSVADVVVVGAHWFSRGEPGSSSSGIEKIFAEACLRD